MIPLIIQEPKLKNMRRDKLFGYLYKNRKRFICDLAYSEQGEPVLFVRDIESKKERIVKSSQKVIQEIGVKNLFEAIRLFGIAYCGKMEKSVEHFDRLGL